MRCDCALMPHMTTRQRRQGPPDSVFRLPPNISVTRHPLPNGVAYVFRDLELGELGRLAVEGTATGEVRMTSEVAGFPSDPMTRRRCERLEPLCMDLMRAINPMGGNGRSASLPVRAPQPVGQVPCEEVRCDTCGKMVAFLVFAEEATDDGRFEDCARLMYAHYAKNNVPAYIIGPALGRGPMEYRPANILQVWPQRGPMECLRPDQFNPRVIELANQHCR